MNKITVALITFGLAVGGCGTPAQITHTPAPAPKVVPLGIDAKPIEYRRIVVKMERGEHIGAYHTGILCIPKGDLTFRGGRVNVNDEELTEVFRQELKKANVPVVGDPNALFEDPSRSRAELIVAGLVTEMKANYCYPMGNFGDFVSGKGEASITVEWQVYSPLDRRVVQKVVTRGTGRLDSAVPNGVRDLFQFAFAEATRGLLADASFHSLVTRAPSNTAAAAVVSSTLMIPRVKTYTASLTNHIAEVQAGVVLIRAAEAHGSGFFITSDGFVITNAHVVQDARFVRLKLATGREVPGEVVAKDDRRDVALVKAQGAGYIPLPIADGEPTVGSEVYAFGAPLEERLFNTVTRGIVSSYRVEDGLKLLQSDVNIQPGNSGGPVTDPAGNVVAISVKGRVNRGVFVGLNFFIPIAEALQSVGVRFRDGVASGG